MESSSLLVAPKPSMIFSATARGPAARRCDGCLVVAAAASKGRGNDGQVQQQLVPSGGKGTTMRARAGGLFAAVAAATTMSHTAPAWSTMAAVEVAALALGELDPATAKTVAGVAGPALSALGFLFILRIVMSWYPRLPVTEFPYVLAYAPTEPFLAVTRKLIPPLAGVDVTPVVWFGLVSFLNEILVGPQGLLLLLSQQQQL